MKRAAERARCNGSAAALMAVAVILGGLDCSLSGAIDIGADDAAPPLSIPCAALPSYQAQYRAQKTRTLPAPIENLAAIASSGSGLWLMQTIWNSGHVSFVHYDPATETLGQPTVQYQVFDRLGTGAAGLEVDSRDFWVALFGNDNSIVRIDPTTGKIVRLPGVAAGGSVDLAWKGSELLVSTAIGHLYGVTPPPSWTERDLYSAPDNDVIRQFSVATCGFSVVVAYRYGQLDIVSPEGNYMVGGIVSDEADFFASSKTSGPIAFYGDQLVVADAAGLEFYTITPR